MRSPNTNKLSVISAALLLAGLPACDTSKAPPDATGADDDDDDDDESGDDSSSAERTIQLHTWWTTAGESAALDTLTSSFRENHPDTSVQLVTAQGGPIGSLIDLVYRVWGNDLPDVFLFMAPEVAMWTSFSAQGGAPANLLYPLDDVLQRTGADTQIPEEVLDLLRLDGVTYGVPIALHRHNTMFYNKSLLADVGSSVPVTLGEFEALCEAVDTYNAGRPSSDHIVTLANAADGFNLDNILLSVLMASADEITPGHGGQYIQDFFDGKKSVRDPEFQRAAGFMNTIFRCSNQPIEITHHVCVGGTLDGGACTADDQCDGGGVCKTGLCQGGEDDGRLCAADAECSGDDAVCAHSYFVTPTFLWEDAARLMRSERAVLFLHGDWTKSEYDETGFTDFGMVPAFGSDGTVIFSATNLATFTAAPHPEIALEFIENALTPSSQARFAARKGAVPPRLDAPLEAFDAKAQETVLAFRSASILQETETLREWIIWEPLLQLWRSRHRDNFASGAQLEADLDVFTRQVEPVYATYALGVSGGQPSF